MPFTNSNNVTATANEQPEYSVAWHPYAIDPAASALLPIGAALQFNAAGVGATPGPGGDGAYTVAYVDIMNVTPVPALYAGIFIGAGTLGAQTPVIPNTVPTVAFVAMSAFSGVVQVLVDTTTTIGHTLNFSSAHAGNLADTAGTTITVGTTVAVALQAVTYVATSLLCWAKLIRQ